MLAAGPLVPGGVVKEPTGREGGGRGERTKRTQGRRGGMGIYGSVPRAEKHVVDTVPGFLCPYLIYLYFFVFILNN